ncbi:hypothetical protein PPYR_05423 [Photinus pyralis]|uniref:Major facilitator superfamily (MFS) profile domain-containing protein n=2 Tax=Photinus pyralis TaxID=7054 RepID=A0A1Y1LPH1_PHOPY|nr:major facilitator superfamily domain-containing protein 12-like isoform X1 [Photinus pyralis]XP_031336646.1 major facilitator superfamily domain-containing protein 12-like isoform X1 [Photinus pyralis]XP_031336647.1 major facilitator superfamily domain-containing protein 12-like isoform X1 [Photinus pyralis]XP_031336648.1 major facilitator superfamily domain-containing protein 12-like isoform X1 [Photinus pyralis]KAB0801069.1 hypothetical protein PPYR_05423 [Photinus pyralis]
MMEVEQFSRARYSCMQKLSFGMGHIYNDLCAAVWFSYTLFYLQVVLQVESSTAGTLIMLGQVVDAVATPIVGWAIDKTGVLKVWHFAGTTAVGVGFSLIFSIVPNTNSWWSILWYSGLIILFQVGWATVQISHLAIIPCISQDHTHSADLTTIRYAASVCCGITVYLITWMVLKTTQYVDKFGPDDFYKFREIAFILSFIGIFSSLLFYCGLHAVNYRYENLSESNGLLRPQSSLLKTSIIYQVSLLYMASRLFTTLNLIYIPLFLEERELKFMPKGDGIRQSIAIVPLVSFLSSFAMSIILKWRPKQMNDKMIYIVGSIFSLIACAWIALAINSDLGRQIYGIACFIGLGSSSTMISSLCLTAEVAKSHGFGGSVYSTVTFTDKLVSGGIVVITQHLSPKSIEMSSNFYGHVLAYVCGSTAVIGLITVTTLYYPRQ